MKSLSDQLLYEKANLCKQQLKSLVTLKQINLEAVNSNCVNDPALGRTLPDSKPERNCQAELKGLRHQPSIRQV